ncbi:MAG: hypothetical protein AB1792_05570, partial [Candidatus Zixiibacteriota bacterium]
MRKAAVFQCRWLVGTLIGVFLAAVAPTESALAGNADPSPSPLFQNSLKTSIERFDQQDRQLPVGLAQAPGGGAVNRSPVRTTPAGALDPVEDCFQAMSVLVISPNPNDPACQNPDPPQTLQGTLIQRRNGPPYVPFDPIPIEILELNLTSAGPITVTLKSPPPTQGLILNPIVDMGGNFQSAPESFFDVFVAIDGYPGGPLVNRDPWQVRSGPLSSLPQNGTPYSPAGGPVPLFHPSDPISAPPSAFLCFLDILFGDPCEPEPVCVYQLSCASGTPDELGQLGLCIGAQRVGAACPGSTCAVEVRSMIGNVCLVWSLVGCFPSTAEPIPGSFGFCPCDASAPTMPSTPTCPGEQSCPGSATCAGGSSCQGSATCSGYYTCMHATCAAIETCRSVTCTAEPSCAGSEATCSPNPTCPHYPSCSGTETCETETCVGWATCRGSSTCPGAPTCEPPPTYQGPECNQPTMVGGASCHGSATCPANHTCGSQTCAASQTCYSPTCTSELTCNRQPTCSYRATCPGAVSCQGTPTCGNTTNTCIGFSTCQGTQTCPGTSTCEEDQPTISAPSCQPTLCNYSCPGMPCPPTSQSAVSCPGGHCPTSAGSPSCPAGRCPTMQGAYSCPGADCATTQGSISCQGGLYCFTVSSGFTCPPASCIPPTYNSYPSCSPVICPTWFGSASCGGQLCIATQAPSPSCGGTATCLAVQCPPPTIPGNPTCWGAASCPANLTCFPNLSCAGVVTCAPFASCGGATCAGVVSCAGTTTCAGTITCTAAHTCQGNPTCPQSATCNTFAATCEGSPTCKMSATCAPWPTCNGTATCANTATCNTQATCNGVQTCPGAPSCAGQPTCNGSATCRFAPTCDGWPTCQPGGYDTPDRLKLILDSLRYAYLDQLFANADSSRPALDWDDWHGPAISPVLFWNELLTPVVESCQFIVTEWLAPPPVAGIIDTEHVVVVYLVRIKAHHDLDGDLHVSVGDYLLLEYLAPPHLAGTTQWFRVEANGRSRPADLENIIRLIAETPPTAAFGCACDCHGDPKCDGIRSNVSDVV